MNFYEQRFPNRARCGAIIDNNRFFKSDIYSDFLTCYKVTQLKNGIDCEESAGIQKWYNGIYLSIEKFEWGKWYADGRNMAITVLLYLISVSKIAKNLPKYISEMVELGHKPRMIMYWLRATDLKQSGTNLSKIAKILKTSRANVYRWDKDFREMEKLRRELECKYIENIYNSNYNYKEFKEDLETLRAIELLGGKYRKHIRRTKKQIELDKK